MKLKIGVSIFILVVINALSVYAQTIPVCGDANDPDGDCPIDTWVIVLVAAFSIFAAYRLHQRKKAFDKPSL